MEEREYYNFMAVGICFKESKRAGTALNVLLSLASFANEDGTAFPSYASIARRARCQRRAAIAAVNALREPEKDKKDNPIPGSEAELQVTPRQAPLGDQTSNLYSILPLVRFRHHPSANGTPGVVHHGAPELRSESNKEQLNTDTPAPSSRGESATQKVDRREPISREEKRPTPFPSRGTVRDKRPVLQEVEGFPVERVVKGWNSIPGVVPFEGEVPPSLRRRILERINTQPIPGWWEKKFDMLKKNDWVCGRSDSKFSVTLSWLLGPNGWDKLTSGELDARPKAERKVAI